MCRVTAIVLLDFIVHVYAKELVANRTDKVVDWMFKRSQKIRWLNHTDLGSSVLAKPGHASLPTSRAQLPSLRSPVQSFSSQFSAPSFQFSAVRSQSSHLVCHLHSTYSSSAALTRIFPPHPIEPGWMPPNLPPRRPSPSDERCRGKDRRPWGLLRPSDRPARKDHNRSRIRSKVPDRGLSATSLSAPLRGRRLAVDGITMSNLHTRPPPEGLTNIGMVACIQIREGPDALWQALMQGLAIVQHPSSPFPITQFMAEWIVSNLQSCIRGHTIGSLIKRNMAKEDPKYKNDEKAAVDEYVKRLTAGKVVGGPFEMQVFCNCYDTYLALYDDSSGWMKRVAMYSYDKKKRGAEFGGTVLLRLSVTKDGSNHYDVLVAAGMR